MLNYSWPERSEENGELKLTKKVNTLLIRNTAIFELQLSRKKF